MIIHARGLVRRDRIVNTWSLSHISVDTSASIFGEDHQPIRGFCPFQSSKFKQDDWNLEHGNFRNQGTLKISSLFMLQWCNFYWELRCFFLTNLHFISAMQTASKNLMETLSDIYEKEWVGQDMLYVQVLKTKNLGWTRAVFQLDVGCEKQFVWQKKMFQAQNNEMLWADLAHKLSDQVVIPLNTYQAQFPEMRVSWHMDHMWSPKMM